MANDQFIRACHLSGNQQLIKQGMFKLLLLVAAVLATCHCLAVQHTADYRLFYGRQLILVIIDNNQISFFGCNKNTGTMQSNDNGRGFRATSFRDNDMFKVASWSQAENQNTCDVDNDDKIKGEFNRVVRKRQLGMGLLNLEDENRKTVFTLQKY